jgi:hypothetical protein
MLKAQTTAFSNRFGRLRNATARPDRRVSLLNHAQMANGCTHIIAGSEAAKKTKKTLSGTEAKALWRFLVPSC